MVPVIPAPGHRQHAARPLGALLSIALGLTTTACTDRPVVDTEGSTEAWPTGPSTATQASTITDGPTTDGPTTPGSTTLAPTTDPSTVSASISTGASSDSSGPLDFGDFCGDGWCSPAEDCGSCPGDCVCPLPAGISGCPPAWSEGSSVLGATELGEFTGITGFFAWEGIGDGDWSTLNLHIFDAGVDLEAAKSSGPWSAQHFSLRAFTGWSYSDNGWFNGDSVVAELVREGEWSSFEVELEIYGSSGSWESYDPNNPALLFGDIYAAGMVDGPQGPFVAAFCDAFVSQVYPE